VDVDPRARVDELAPAERALIANVRAIEGMPREGGILVLDEPGALLPAQGRERLAELARAVADGGSSVLLVSHDVREVKRVADRFTVLRDGRDVGRGATEEVEVGELVELIVGHPIGAPARSGGAVRRPNGAISIADLSGELVRDVSIGLRRGEVVGLAGLAGSGFDEVPYLLFGARPCRAGRLLLDVEHDLTTMTPARALRAGVALLPADRARAGAAPSLPVGDNVTLTVLDSYVAGLRLDRRRLARDAGRLLAEHDVRPSDPGVPFAALSGGNQQRALLAKWLQTGPPLLLLDEPTRGVDVGARAAIDDTIRALAIAGTTVLCASADYDQLGTLCDRVLIFADGRLVGELTGADLTSERIAERCQRAA
jgi:ribose transport system ATP-binding protein